MLVQPQQAATVCELDLMQHAIRSCKRAQPWIRNNDRRTPHEPLKLTLDCEHAHVNGRSLRSTAATHDAPKAPFKTETNSHEAIETRNLAKSVAVE
jgi:hypothetical protein